MGKKEEFLKKLKETFRIEAEETINNISADLVKLEKNNPKDAKSELLEVIYRAAHSLKGASRAVNESELEMLCHALEDFMDTIKNGIHELTPAVFDLLHQTVDLLMALLNREEEDTASSMEERVMAQIEKLKNPSLVRLSNHEPPVVETSVPEKVSEKAHEKEKEVVTSNKKEAVDAAVKASSDTVRISVEKIDKLLVQAEDMLSLKLSAIHQADALQQTLLAINSWEKQFFDVATALREVKQRLTKSNGDAESSNKSLSRIVDFIDFTEKQISQIKNEIKALRYLSQQEVFSAGEKIDSLSESVKSIIRIPFSSLLHVFPKMVRDISKDLGKEIDFVVEGDEVEIDRRVLEKMRAPLIHLIRNAIDYGIESPAERKAKNKPSTGKLSVKIAQQENGMIDLMVMDDGAGINQEKLKQRYIANEGIDEEQASKLTENELLNYIFKSGVSTSEIVTDISGRGLGLAIVQETVEKLGGSITIQSKAGVSTSFIIHLPMSVVTFRGVLISVGDQEFILPTSRLLSVMHYSKDEIKNVEGRQTILFDGKVVHLVKLADILEIGVKEKVSDKVLTVVIEVNKIRIAFVVDAVQREREVLVKNFNKHIVRLRNISGATVLGSGKVVPILNVYDLINAAQQSDATAKAAGRIMAVEQQSRKTVLIVEDSITSRTLIKNILKSADYDVTTAVDGIDGFTKLKSGNFDAVVTDVEMPRMNGFELTSKIRAEKKYKNLPVILVTSLSKREHREKGIEVGANAYIIKSDFEQSNLLETLDRLL